MVTLKKNPAPRAPSPFLFHGLGIIGGSESFLFFRVLQQNLGATVQWMTKFVPVRKKPILTPPAKTTLKHLPEGLPPVQHQRTFELTEEIETRFTSVTK